MFVESTFQVPYAADCLAITPASRSVSYYISLSLLATVLFRDQLYDAGLMIAFMDHVSRWRHVLSDVHHYIGGYRTSTTAPESWDNECDSSAALLDHRRLWGSVMQELLLLHVPSPLELVHLHRGPISRSSLRHRRRTSLPLRIALARKLTTRHVRRCLLTAFNQS